MAVEQVVSEFVCQRKVDTPLRGDGRIVEDAPLAVPLRNKRALESGIEAPTFDGGDWFFREKVTGVFNGHGSDFDREPGITSIDVDGRKMLLSPGMSVTVEVKTGKRRILEYLFSPLAEISSQAMQER